MRKLNLKKNVRFVNVRKKVSLNFSFLFDEKNIFFVKKIQNRQNNCGKITN